MWTADELKRVRELLVAQLRELDHTGGPRGEGARAAADAEEYPSDGSADQEELATRLAEEDVDLRVQAVEGQLRAEVAGALVRLDGGRYGVCERCRGKITKERLRALPHARWCMPCARGDNR